MCVCVCVSVSEITSSEARRLTEERKITAETYVKNKLIQYVNTEDLQMGLIPCG